MKATNTIVKAAVGMAILSALPTVANAHGWSEFPNARQNICYEQGGVWSGNPPNAACAQAKDISGTYPFVQRNEYSKNVEDYRNMDAVKAAIPDGTLCYANDPQKAGMGAPHTGWTRTKVNAGTFEFVFNATAAHNPSYWEFYLTKPDADLSKALAWDDLELIQTVDDVPVEGGKYRMNVTIPSDRSGNAILFVRWQRIDAAGEGFYNCSDITIVNGDLPPPDPTPEPTPEQNLVKGDLYIPADFVGPDIGDTVKYDIIDNAGRVERSFDIEVDTSNVNDWERLLASEINGWHAEFTDGSVFIGDWHEEMNHYMYFQDDPSRNFFNSKDGLESGHISVIDEPAEQLTGDIYELITSDNIVNAGDKVVIATSEAATLTQTQGTTVAIKNNGTTSVVVDTSSLTQNETLSFVANAVNSERAGTFTFEVVKENVNPDPEPKPDPTPNPDPSVDAWDVSATYVNGDVVSYAGENWKAQWWIKGGDDPKTTYEKDKWGVWQPTN